MKHRSVIAYVIVAAALFAAPQLSHDLQAFRSALGSRVSVGLMQTFLSLPSAEDAAARAGAPLPAGTRLASCPKQKPAAKQRKAEPARAGTRVAEVRGVELAMIEPPPLSEPWSPALSAGSPAPGAGPPRKALAELAMIIPPDGGIDPRESWRLGAEETRRLAGRVRVDFVDTRHEGKDPEWRKADEALRNMGVAAPGSYEFRLDLDGKRTKVLKVRRGSALCCPAAPAPRAPRTAGGDAAAATPPPVSAAAAHATFVSE